MKFYKDDKGTVYAFAADGSEDAFIPAELVAITEAEADELRKPVESHDDAKARALALLRTERAPILSVLDGLQVSAMVKGDTTTAQAIETLKDGLKNAPAAIPWDSCATFEAMRKAGKVYYAQLVAGASPAVLTAFSEAA